MTRIDLIKRGDALDALQIVAAWSTKEQRRALSQAYDKLHRVSAVDAVPVVHGQWVYGEDVDIQCSECGRDAMSDWMKHTQVYSPYCPWCGAKMDAKEGEQDEG